MTRPNREYDTLEEIIFALLKGESNDRVYVAKKYTKADLIRDLKKQLKVKK